MSERFSALITGWDAFSALTAVILWFGELDESHKCLLYGCRAYHPKNAHLNSPKRDSATQ